ncbi:MAG: type II secretion system F family protein [Natronospirillum sp.]
MNETLILLAVFTAVLVGAFAVINIFAQRRQIQQNIQTAQQVGPKINTDELLATGNENLRYYLDVVMNEHKDSTRARLVRAGYYEKSAYGRFNLMRLLIVATVIAGTRIFLPQVAETVTNLVAWVIALVLGGLAFILCSYFLERRGNLLQREYRKMFPDFMDLLLVCLDAGLSIDAAFVRVTREFLQNVPHFGIQLSIINLETRAGRPLRDALHNFAERVGLDEAKSLAVLFRQSEELGSSVAKTLRTFASEMRQMRIVKAEEKANQLPIKMLFPMAFFMFPVSLIIVLVPIMMSLLQLLLQMQPGG